VRDLVERVRRRSCWAAAKAHRADEFEARNVSRPARNARALDGIAKASPPGNWRSWGARITSPDGQSGCANVIGDRRGQGRRLALRRISRRDEAAWCRRRRLPAARFAQLQLTKSADVALRVSSERQSSSEISVLSGPDRSAKQVALDRASHSEPDRIAARRRRGVRGRTVTYRWVEERSPRASCAHEPG